MERLDRFRDCCCKWQIILGLQDWHIDCYEKKINKTSYAEVAYNVTTRKADITLNPISSNGDSMDDSMERFARHELLHLVTADLTNLIANYYTLEKIMSIEHAAINRILAAFEILEEKKPPEPEFIGWERETNG